MKKWLASIVFSILLLVPIGVQNVYGIHPQFSCPPGGTLNTNPLFTFGGSTNFCNAGAFINSCVSGYSFGNVNFGATTIPSCVATPTPSPTPAGACQNGAILDNTGHCVPDFPNICSTGTVQAGFTCIAQAMNNLIGGQILNIDSISLLVGAIGVNPVITGLVGISVAGIVGQAVWVVHRKRKSENS